MKHIWKAIAGAMILLMSLFAILIVGYLMSISPLWIQLCIGGGLIGAILLMFGYELYEILFNKPK